MRLQGHELPVLAPDGPAVPLEQYRAFEKNQLIELVGSLRERGKTHVLAVAGPSGSGKSQAIKGLDRKIVRLCDRSTPVAKGKVNIVQMPIISDDAAVIQNALARNNLESCDELLFFYPQPLGEMQWLTLARERTSPGLFEMLLGGAKHMFARRPFGGGFTQSSYNTGRAINKDNEPLLQAMYYFNMRHPDYGGGDARWVPDEEAEYAQVALGWTRELIGRLDWTERDMIKLLMHIVDFDVSSSRGQRLGIEAGFRSILDCVNALKVLLLFVLLEQPDLIARPAELAEAISGMRDHQGPLSMDDLFENFRIFNCETIVDNPKSMSYFLASAQREFQWSGADKTLVELLLKPLT